MNLFFLLGAVFCLYLALPQTEAVSMHCGYHIVGHYVTTLYNNTHYTRYYRVMYGICNSQGVIISLNFSFLLICTVTRLYTVKITFNLERIILRYHEARIARHYKDAFQLKDPSNIEKKPKNIYVET